MSKKNVLWGALLCLVASMSWGAMFPVAHIALQKIDPFYFSTIRYFFAAVILSIILLIKEGRAAFKLEGKGLALTLYGTLAFTVYNMCIFWGQSMMGEPGTVAASIMEVLMPMISVVIVWITTRKAPKRHTIFSVVAALLGAILVITNGKLSFFTEAGQNLLPLFLMLIAVIGWVLYSMGGEKMKDWSTLRYSTITCILGNIVSIIVTGAASAAGTLPVPSLQVLIDIKYEMAFMVLIPGILALLSWNMGIKMLSAVNGTLFINAVPLTAFAIIALQGYSVSHFEMIGTALIIIALVHNNLMERKTMPTVAKPARIVHKMSA